MCVLAPGFHGGAFPSSGADLGWQEKLGGWEGGRSPVPCVLVVVVPGIWFDAQTVFVEWN